VKNRLPAWIWDPKHPEITWETLAKNYKYPGREIMISELTGTELPINPTSLNSLDINRMRNERNDIPHAFRYAYTTDLDEDFPDVWTTWCLSITTAWVSDKAKRNPGYVTDNETVQGLLRPLAFKLLDILECWELVLKYKDLMEKQQVQKGDRPEGISFKFKSTKMQRFEYQFKTNTSIKLGLLCNQYKLEAAIADFHATILEFDWQYSVVINKKIFQFLKDIGAIIPNNINAITATHMVRGYASHFNQILIQEVIRMRDDRAAYLKKEREKQVMLMKAKLAAQNLSIKELIEEQVSRELRKGRGKDSLRVITPFDDNNGIYEPIVCKLPATPPHPEVSNILSNNKTQEDVALPEKERKREHNQRNWKWWKVTEFPKRQKLSLNQVLPTPYPNITTQEVGNRGGKGQFNRGRGRGGRDRGGRLGGVGRIGRGGRFARWHDQPQPQGNYFPASQAAPMIASTQNPPPLLPPEIKKSGKKKGKGKRREWEMIVKSLSQLHP
jgi:hypothetical protein